MKQAKVKNAYKVTSNKYGVFIEGNDYHFDIDWMFPDNKKSQRNIAKFLVEKMNKAYKIGVIHGIFGKEEQDSSNDYGRK